MKSLMEIKKMGCGELARETKDLLTSMENQINIEWAKKNNEAHVLLSTNGGQIHVNDLKILKFIKRYPDDQNQLDMSSQYSLFKVESKANQTENSEKVDATIMTKIYQNASKLKLLGYHQLARDLFLFIEDRKYHLWGVYFHLGEIDVVMGKIDEAMNNFNKCLNLNPSHKKARQYLKNQAAELHNRSVFS
jgi:TolA-binding protein